MQSFNDSRIGRLDWRVCRMGVTLLVGVLFLNSHVHADTIAYWRHEDGPVGEIIPDGPDTVLDSSVYGNHMQTFSSAAPPHTAATYSPLVSPLPLRSGLPNTMSLDFGPNPSFGIEDGGGLNDDNYTQGKMIQTHLFSQLTVELAFNMNAIGGYQALLGRDGKPLGDEPGEPDSPVPPLKILVRGDNFPNEIDNQLFVEWIDGNGEIHHLASGTTVTAGTWNHIAFTLTDSAAELWVAGETGDYVLRDAISGANFAGASNEVMIYDPAPISVGRGMWNNGVADWADALIDEVRISDVALTPDQFLFETVPGPDNADFDGDGVIDGHDFLTWQRGFGSTYDASDLALWEAQFGGSSAIAAVPEPTSMALLAGVLLTMVAAPRVVRDARCVHGNV